MQTNIKHASLSIFMATYIALKAGFILRKSVSPDKKVLPKFL